MARYQGSRYDENEPYRHHNIRYQHDFYDDSSSEHSTVDNQRSHARDYGRPSSRPPPRYRSYSPSSYDSRSPSPYRHASGRSHGRNHNKYDKLAKISLGVGLLQVIAGLLSLWTTKKGAEKDEAIRRERRRDFERAKRQRRADEARWQRQRESDIRAAEDEFERRREPQLIRDRSIVSGRSRSMVSRGRAIEAGPGWETKR